MTLTETLSYLRRIQPQWNTTDIPADKAAALEAACLIETRSEPVPSVRLTPTGQRCKEIAESYDQPCTAAARASSNSFQARPRRQVTPARQLV